MTVREVAENGWNRPYTAVITRAPADWPTAWTEGYSGCGGVGSAGDQTRSTAVAGLPSRSAFLIAVTGRQNRKV